MILGRTRTLAFKQSRKSPTTYLQQGTKKRVRANLIFQKVNFII